MPKFSFIYFHNVCVCGILGFQNFLFASIQCMCTPRPHADFCVWHFFSIIINGKFSRHFQNEWMDGGWFATTERATIASSALSFRKSLFLGCLTPTGRPSRSCSINGTKKNPIQTFFFVGTQHTTFVGCRDSYLWGFIHSHCLPARPTRPNFRIGNQPE